MPRNGIDDAIERLQRANDADGVRYVDLRLELELAGEVMLSVGGRWDRQVDEFIGDADGAVVVRMHDGQRTAVSWFADWLDEHAIRRENPPTLTPAQLDGDFELDTDPTHAYSALFAGGRRGGKSWIAIALCVAYAIRFPGAIVWIVSSADTKHEELRRYMAGVLAAEWIDRETEAIGWFLCNGSQLLLKSAFNPEDLKEGKANLVFLNEGQKMRERAYTVTRGAIADASGLVLVAANPPVEAGDQTWVSNFAADAASGRRASVFVEFDPLLNPHIDRIALLSMAYEVDEHTYDTEVKGLFRGPRDAVAYNWVRLENEGPPPSSSDCTEAFMRAIEEGDGIRQVVGLDVQRVPHIGGPVYRFFGEPYRDRVLVWIVGEVVLEGGDEEDWCGALAEAGLHPDETLIICDASGRYQHSRRRSMDSPPPHWKGRGSFDLIRGAGYHRIKPPDPKFKDNPAIVDRARAFTSMICSRAGGRRLFADPDSAPKTCDAIRDWRNVHGKPSRTSDHAHLGDAASYPIVRFFPRLLRADRNSGNPRAVDPVASKVDKVVATFATPAELRITLPRSGPSPTKRRGSRIRGM